MKVAVLVLVLLGTAWAHWPYADKENKFRMSAMNVLSGTDIDLITENTWMFSPFNNQHLLTFQLNMFRKTTAVAYYLSFSHIAEVTQENGQYFTVPHSAIYFNTEKQGWHMSNMTWTYDPENFGEVVEYTLRPDNDDGAIGGFKMAVVIVAYPDSQNDIIDVTLFLWDYVFVDEFEHQLAIFYRMFSSAGRDGSVKHIPLSIDFPDLSFDINPMAYVDEPKCVDKRTPQEKRRRTVANVTVEPAAHKHTMGRKRDDTKVFNQKTVQESIERAERRAELERADDTTFVMPEWGTPASIWPTGGFIATVFGNQPGDVCSGTDVATTITFSLRSTTALEL